MHWNSVCSALSCTAARSSFAWSEQGRSTGRPTPLKLEAEQLQKLAQLGYEPAEEAQGSPPSDLGFLDQVMSPFRSEPHTLIGLVVLGAYVLFTGWAGVLGGDEPQALRARLGLSADAPVPEDAAELLRLRSSLWFSGVVFVGYCWLQLRDGYITRPHPAFWRGAHGVMILYLLFVVFLYVQPSAQNAREVLRVLDPTLDSTLAPLENTKEYATDCRVVDSSGFPSRILHDTIFDIFFLSHFIGWFCVMIMFRDWWICWLMSIHFEFLEMTFQYMLPNFKECWWDHLLLDVLGMNFFGMFLGSLVVRYFEMPTQTWVSVDGSAVTTSADDASDCGSSQSPVATFSHALTSPRSRRIARQFLPLQWTHVSWDVLGSGRRFLGFLLAASVLNTVQITAFFLKFILYLGPEDQWNKWRILGWMLLGMPFVRELYVFTALDSPKRLGHNTWLGLAVIVAEWSFIFKFAEGEIVKAGRVRGVDPFAPNPWLWAWALSTTFLCAFALLHFAPVSFVQDHLFDYAKASSTSRGRMLVDSLLLLSIATPSVLGTSALSTQHRVLDPDPSRASAHTT
jgi:phosphatidylserine synthase 2